MRNESSIQRVFEIFVPTILVCALFLGWVFYDRKVRPQKYPIQPETEILLTEALKNFRKGERETALRLAKEASNLEPQSELAQELEKLFKSARTRKKSSPRNQRRR